MRAQIISAERLTDDVVTFWLQPEQPLRYIAGQFIELSLQGIIQRHWFTLSSSPTEPLLAITTRCHHMPISDYKQVLSALQPGDSVTISEPMGDFVLPRSKDMPLFFIIGGIGITPVRSMAKWLVDSREQRTATVWYGANVQSDLVFLDTLKEAGFHLETYTKDRAPIQQNTIPIEDIIKILIPLKQKLVYISGPEPMVEGFVAKIKQAGIPGHQLVTDYFPGYSTI